MVAVEDDEMAFDAAMARGIKQLKMMKWNLMRRAMASGTVAVEASSGASVFEASN